MKPYLLATLAAIALTTCACSTGSTPAAQPAATVTVTTQPSTSTPAGAPTPTATITPAIATSSPAAPTAPSGCLTRYLNGSIGLTQGTAGAVLVVIRFKNLNNLPCTLYGYPGVSQASGLPIKDLGHPSTENPTTPRVLITLAPGGYANATLQISDASNFSLAQCAPKTVHWLAVIPPNQTVPLYIHFTSVTCKGSAHLLEVTTVQRGDGG